MTSTPVTGGEMGFGTVMMMLSRLFSFRFITACDCTWFVKEEKMVSLQSLVNERIVAIFILTREEILLPKIF